MRHYSWTSRQARMRPSPSGELAVSDEAKSLRGRVRRSDLVLTVFVCSLLFRP